MREEWMIPEEALPEQTKVEKVNPIALELGSERMRLAAGLIGEAAAVAAAQHLGPYLLDEALRREVELAGVSLGDDASFPALDRRQWARDLPTESFSALEQRLKSEGREIYALVLGRRERKDFASFLAHSAQAPATFADFLETARHFFFREPLSLATRPRVGNARGRC